MECIICLNSLFEEGEIPTLEEPEKQEEENENSTSRRKQPPRFCKDTSRADIPQLCCPPCGHIFHRVCLLDWIDRGHRNCPICRKECIPKRKLNPVILKPVIPPKMKQAEKSNRDPCCAELLAELENMETEKATLEKVNSNLEKRTLENQARIQHRNKRYRTLGQEKVRQTARNVREQRRVRQLEEKVLSLANQLAQYQTGAEENRAGASGGFKWPF